MTYTITIKQTTSTLQDYVVDAKTIGEAEKMAMKVANDSPWYIDNVELEVYESEVHDNLEEMLYDYAE